MISKWNDIQDMFEKYIYILYIYIYMNHNNNNYIKIYQSRKKKTFCYQNKNDKKIIKNRTTYNNSGVMLFHRCLRQRSLLHRQASEGSKDGNSRIRMLWLMAWKEKTSSVPQLVIILGDLFVFAVKQNL